MLELRVLTGTHAGARALLSAEPQWIGSGDDCALILTDEGLLDQHAQIEHRPDGTLVLRWQDENQSAVVLKPGESAWVGPVRIAVEVLGSPWRDDLPIASEPLAPEPVPETHPVPRPARTRARAAWITLAGLALSAGGAALAWPWALSALPRQAAPAPSNAPALQATQEPLAQLISRLGFKGRVLVDTSDPQAPGVKAMFLSDQEVETLANELAQRRPRPHLSLVDEAQAAEQVVQGVQRIGTLHETTLSTRYLGEGKFRVEGQVNEAAQRTQITADLRDSYPQAAAFEVAIGVRAEAARALVEGLRQRGIAPVQARWEQGLLTMDVRLPPGGLPHWERALLEVAAQHDVPFQAEVRGLDPAGGTDPPQFPFKVRSVVATPVPYVVLDDGRKLAAGGEIKGWRLVGVDHRAVRFEGPQGHPMILER